MSIHSILALGPLCLWQCFFQSLSESILREYNLCELSQKSFLNIYGMKRYKKYELLTHLFPQASFVTKVFLLAMLSKWLIDFRPMKSNFQPKIVNFPICGELLSRITRGNYLRFNLIDFLILLCSIWDTESCLWTTLKSSQISKYSMTIRYLI